MIPSCSASTRARVLHKYPCTTSNISVTESGVAFPALTDVVQPENLKGENTAPWDSNEQIWSKWTEWTNELMNTACNTGWKLLRTLCNCSSNLMILMSPNSCPGTRWKSHRFGSCSKHRNFQTGSCGMPLPEYLVHLTQPSLKARKDKRQNRVTASQRANLRLRIKHYQTTTVAPQAPQSLHKFQLRATQWHRCMQTDPRSTTFDRTRQEAMSHHLETHTARHEAVRATQRSLAYHHVERL